MTTFETRFFLLPSPVPRPSVAVEAAEPAPRTLVEAIQAVVRRVDNAVLGSAVRPEAGLATRPHSLLAVLVYCYARDIYSSQEIENALWQDAALREMSGREIPAARTLRWFRRHHRQAVSHCLQAALAFLSQQAGTGHDESAEAQWAEEAERRLMKAVFIDHMEMEDSDF